VGKEAGLCCVGHLLLHPVLLQCHMLLHQGRCVHVLPYLSERCWSEVTGSGTCADGMGCYWWRTPKLHTKLLQIMVRGPKALRLAVLSWTGGNFQRHEHRRQRP